MEVDAMGDLRHEARRESVELFPPAEVAKRLGCSEPHIYRLVEAGALRAVDISQPGSRRSKTRIRSDDLAAYIEERTRLIPRQPAASVSPPGRRAIPPRGSDQGDPDALGGDAA
jgi:excisionase family DNA binding protein